MPCNEVNLISVDLKAADKNLLIESLKSLGYTYQESNGSMYINTPRGQIVLKNGQAQMDSRAQGELNKIKQAYSSKVVSALAKKYKMNITTKPSGQIVLRRY